MARLSADPARYRAAAAIAVSVVLLGLRLRLATLVGFGDAEALYAAYALHPQPAYLDHPGLVGIVARLLGGGGAPTPLVAHQFTALAATLVPWLGFGAARAAGTPRERAYDSFFALAFLPELSIGLFGLTPDLPLAALWLAALGSAALAVRSPPGSRAALGGLLFAGLFGGLAVTAKVTGVLLCLALAASLVRGPARAHLRTAAPYAGALAALIVVMPLFLWEQARGFPLLAHRLVATQAAAGPSLRNLAALVGGQLLYVTPPFLWGAWECLRKLRLRSDDAVDRLFVLACIVPGVPLVVVCLWSRVAEPHWLGPAYLSLALGLGRLPRPPRALVRSAVAIGVVAPVVAFVLVATPLLPKLSGKGYRPRYDLVNDLYAWRLGARVVSDAVERARAEGYAPVIVTPHWTVCAQVHVALGAGTPVGCRTKEGDDFAGWYPEREWSRAPVLLYVTDDRFPRELAKEFPARDVVGVESVDVFRGGHVVRTIRVTRLERAAHARAPLRCLLRGG
jgi:hypothetical protein